MKTKKIFCFRRQEEITAEREEIDRQKKLLMKKRPTNSETGRKRAGSQSGTAGVGAAVGQATGTGAAVLHNGTDAATFLKPEALPTFSQQEYYEADEILKVRNIP